MYIMYLSIYIRDDIEILHIDYGGSIVTTWYQVPFFEINSIFGYSCYVYQ